MRKIALLTAAATCAFAAGDKAAATAKTTDTAATATTDTATKAKQDRVAPVLATVRNDVPMPATPSRGSKSAYNFDTLEIGGSIGVKNKTATQLSSIVSNQNRKHQVNKTDANGQVIFKEGTTEPQKVPSKLFKVFDVDAKSDPDGATARIFRVAL